MQGLQTPLKLRRTKIGTLTRCGRYVLQIQTTYWSIDCLQSACSLFRPIWESANTSNSILKTVYLSAITKKRKKLLNSWKGSINTISWITTLLFLSSLECRTLWVLQNLSIKYAVKLLRLELWLQWLLSWRSFSAKFLWRLKLTTSSGKNLIRFIKRSLMASTAKCHMVGNSTPRSKLLEWRPSSRLACTQNN